MGVISFHNIRTVLDLNLPKTIVIVSNNAYDHQCNNCANFSPISDSEVVFCQSQGIMTVSELKQCEHCAAQIQLRWEFPLNEY